VFTDEQQAIIQHPAGHARVAAVAGSGKSTTLVERIGYLLEQGVDARRILVLMFNRDARISFERVLKKRLGKRFLQLPEVRTYHAFALKLVKACVDRGLLPNLPLVTEKWRKEKIARHALRRYNRNQAPDGEQLADFLSYIDLRKAALINDPAGIDAYPREFASAYDDYEQLRQSDGVRFFEDLLKDTAMLFEQSEDARNLFADHMEHIVVDEFQDTAPVQAAILKVVAGTRADVMVVGDNDQCIYEWRGADPSIMGHQFERDFPHTTRYALSHTFRFGHRVSLLANHVIRHNKQRDPQLCVSAAENPATQVRVVSDAEGDPALDAVAEWLAEGRKYQDVMVLYRLWALSLPIELAFLQTGIPYRIEGDGKSVFHRTEVIALLGYLRLLDSSLWGHEAVKDIASAMLDFPSLFLKQPDKQVLLRDLLSQDVGLHDAFSAAAKRADVAWQQDQLLGAGRKWMHIQGLPDKISAGDALKQIVKALQISQSIDKAKQTPSRKAEAHLTVRSLVQFAINKGMAITQFLALCDELAWSDVAEHDSHDRVVITTVHRCKGLEAPMVFIPGVEQGLFPSLRQDRTTDIEAERRLFYVAITRAKERLIVVQPWPMRYFERWVNDPTTPVAEEGPS
jgi:DNA helicase-2/ATP-dependent DNA helicase PcrA